MLMHNLFKSEFLTVNYFYVHRHNELLLVLMANLLKDEFLTVYYFNVHNYNGLLLVLKKLLKMNF